MSLLGDLDLVGICFRNDPSGLAANPRAPTFDWLDRDPRGVPYTRAELEALEERVA